MVARRYIVTTNKQGVGACLLSSLKFQNAFWVAAFASFLPGGVGGARSASPSPLYILFPRANFFMVEKDVGLPEVSDRRFNDACLVLGIDPIEPPSGSSEYWEWFRRSAVLWSERIA